MLLRDTLTEVLSDQRNNLLHAAKGIERDKLQDIALSASHVIIISGIRRCGKSTLLKQLIGKQKSFCYLNFEDFRIFGFGIEDFAKLDSLVQKKPDAWFFDEIQSVSHWERFIRTLSDRKSMVCITASNASLLSKELGTKLTGRHLRYELFPFSYGEFLRFRDEKPGLASFNNYFLSGGFPEFLESGNPQIHQELFNDIITRDIIVRYGLKDEKIVKEIALYLITNIGKEFSFTRLTQLHGVSSKNTVISLIGYLEDSYLLFPVSRFDYSLRKQTHNPKKIYAIDTGFINANSVSFSRDDGRLLENIVFIELKRRGSEVWYFRQKTECDFITRNNGAGLSAFQVCYELTPDNQQREVAGLLEALDYLKTDTGIILTLNQEDSLSIEGKQIRIMPVWKWIMQKEKK